VALISAVLVLMLIAAVALVLMITSTSERAMASNVHVARGSLLAADAGVRATQQLLANTARTKLDSVLLNYTGSGFILTNPGGLFPAGNLSTSGSSPGFNATATIAWADSDITDTSQVYDFKYTVTSTGTFGRAGERQVQSTGMLRVSAERQTFAQYLLYTDKHTMANGGSIWFSSDTRFDGHVHTNGQFRFAYNPQFLDRVSSVHNKAWYYNKNNPKELAANNNGTIDVPSFYGGFQRSSVDVPMPTNSFNQQSAALGLAVTGASPSNGAIRTALGLGGSGAPPNGVYLVNSTAAPPVGFDGWMTGGIYVQGALTQMTMVADTVNNRQRYVLVQGSTTSTIVVDPAAGSTTITTGGTTNTYKGLPRGVTYVNGTVSDLRGPDRSGATSPPALLDGQQMLIASTGDVVIQRDITMEHFDTGTAVLGIFSSGGDVRIGTSAPNNMKLDAFVMATGGGATGEGVFTVDNYNSGSPRGQFTLRGGVTAQYYGAFYTFATNGTLQTGYARNFLYDRRGLVPPYYPSTNLYVQTDRPRARTLAWKEL
jgi:Tfp pilus assembly protein PilX